MPSIEELPILTRIAAALDGIRRQNEEVTEALLGHLGRAEKREENAALVRDGVAHSLGEVEEGLADLTRQLGALLRVAAKALSAARASARANEIRLTRLEDAAQPLPRRPRSEMARAYEEELEDYEPPSDRHRFRRKPGDLPDR